MGNGFPRDAESHAAVLGNERRCQVDSAVEDERERTLGKLDEVPCHIRHLAHIALQTVGRVHEAEHRLGFGPLLESEDAAHGFLVGGIAADAPNCVGGVENEAAPTERLNGLSNIFCYFFLRHTQCFRIRW